jgi:hypothetical protein
MDLNSGDLKLEMKIILKISSSKRPKLFASKIKFYSNSKILIVLVVNKYSLQPVVVWSQDPSFLKIWTQKPKKNLPGTNGLVIIILLLVQIID